MLKIRVNFKMTAGGFKNKIYEFDNQGHYLNWYKKQIKDESYRKIIGTGEVKEIKHFGKTDDV